MGNIAMTTGQALANSFYQAFAKRDSAAMNIHYAENACFSDPVFTNLSCREVHGMWEMLCFSAKDFNLTFEIIEATESHAKVQWTATYSFGPANRRVENRVTSRMEIAGGKIVRHVDDFSFPRWARQALGPVGLILGPLPFFQKKVQTTALAKLAKHLSKK
jgi:ketosteroid isomerase-like protein